MQKLYRVQLACLTLWNSQNGLTIQHMGFIEFPKPPLKDGIWMSYWGKKKKKKSCSSHISKKVYSFTLITNAQMHFYKKDLKKKIFIKDPWLGESVYKKDFLKIKFEFKIFWIFFLRVEN